MQLESLDEIKKRDHSNEQKRILESINERKERSHKAVYGEQYAQNQPKNPKRSEGQNAKSFAYLEKVKRQAGLEDDNREAFNFHRVLKQRLDAIYLITRQYKQGRGDLVPSLTEAVGAELLATGQHKQQVISMCQTEINAEFAEYSKPESKLMTKFRQFYDEQPKPKNFQSLVPATLNTDLGYTLAPSCKERVLAKLSEAQKLDKKRLKTWMGAKVVRTL